MRLILPNGLLDRAQDTAGVMQDVLIPEAEHAVAQGFQFCCAFGICSLLPAMLATVQFDDQLRRQAGEVRHIGTHRVLAAEPEPGELLSAQVEPEGFLGIGRIAPQSPGAGGRP